jgi:hypothetical protein
MFDDFLSTGDSPDQQTALFQQSGAGDIGEIQMSDVPQSFNDAWFTGNTPSPMGEDNIAPDDPGFFGSQSTVEPNDGSSSFPTKALTNGFLDTASKLLTSLRGNTGQDRNSATGRARPQRSVADLLGLTASAGAVNVQAPGNQGMWMIVILAAAFLVLMLFAGKR